MIWNPGLTRPQASHYHPTDSKALLLQPSAAAEHLALQSSVTRPVVAVPCQSENTLSRSSWMRRVRFHQGLGECLELGRTALRGQQACGSGPSETAASKLVTEGGTRQTRQTRRTRQDMHATLEPPPPGDAAEPRTGCCSLHFPAKSGPSQTQQTSCVC